MSSGKSAGEIKGEALGELVSLGTLSGANAQRQWLKVLNTWSAGGQFANADEVKQHHLNPWRAYK